MNGYGRGEENQNQSNGSVVTRETFGMTLLFFSVILTVFSMAGSLILGDIGRAIESFLYGSLGFFVYPFFALCIYGSLVLISGKKFVSGKNVLRAVLLSVSIFLIAHLATSVRFSGNGFGEYINGCWTAAGTSVFQSTAGGVIFGLVVYPALAALTLPGAYVVFSLIAVACLVFFLFGTPARSLFVHSRSQKSRTALKERREDQKPEPEDEEELPRQKPVSRAVKSDYSDDSSLDSKYRPPLDDRGEYSRERSGYSYEERNYPPQPPVQNIDYYGNPNQNYGYRNDPQTRGRGPQTNPYDQRGGNYENLYPPRDMGPRIVDPRLDPSSPIARNSRDFRDAGANFGNTPYPPQEPREMQDRQPTPKELLFSKDPVRDYWSNLAYNGNGYFNNRIRKSSVQPVSNSDFQAAASDHPTYSEEYRAQAEQPQRHVTRQVVERSEEPESGYTLRTENLNYTHIPAFTKPQEKPAEPLAPEKTDPKPAETLRFDRDSSVEERSDKNRDALDDKPEERSFDRNRDVFDDKPEERTFDRSRDVFDDKPEERSFDRNRDVFDDKPEERSFDRSRDVFDDKPEERSFDRNRDVFDDKPEERSFDRSRDVFDDKPEERSFDRSRDVFDDKPEERSFDRSRDVFDDKPEERSFDRSRDVFDDKPEERSFDRSRDVFNDKPEERSFDRSRDVFDDKPEERTFDRSRDVFDEKPEERSFDRSREESDFPRDELFETEETDGTPMGFREESIPNLFPDENDESAFENDIEEPRVIDGGGEPSFGYDEVKDFSRMESEAREEQFVSGASRAMSGISKTRSDIFESDEMDAAPSDYGETPIPAPKQKHVYKPYHRPSLSLLKKYDDKITVSQEEIDRNSAIITDTLAGFRVDAEVINVTPGPSVTRYDIDIPRNISLNTVTKRSGEIAMRLHARDGVNMYANNEAGTISIEVPNAVRATVGLSSVLEAKEYQEDKPGSLIFAIGKDIEGRNVCGDIPKMTHILVAGTTNAGKSVALNAMLVSLVCKYSPEELRLILVDPKRTEFIVYDGLPHLMINEIIGDAQKAIMALNWSIKEMERRYAVFEQKTRSGVAVRNVDEYNANLTEDEERLPKIVFVVDELADLMSVAKKDIEERIQRLTQKARAAGIHLVLATQRPSVDVITGVIKGNLPTRMAVRVIQEVDSRTILDEGGAEKLLGMGDMLYKAGGMFNCKRVQGAFISTAELQAIMEDIKQNNESYFDPEVSDYINHTEEVEEDEEDDRDRAGSAPRGKSGEGEALYIKALAMVVKLGSASISLIQRRCGVGYNHAGKIMEWMEEKGYVSPFDGKAKARTVLLTKEEFESLYGPIDR